MTAVKALEIGWDELQPLLGSADAPRLIDCREQDGWDICKIEGAELVPLSQFPELPLARLGSDAPAKARHIVVYCHHGVRSLRATQWLRQQGYSQTQSLRGGIDLWADCAEPGMRKY